MHFLFSAYLAGKQNRWTIAVYVGNSLLKNMQCRIKGKNNLTKILKRYSITLFIYSCYLLLSCYLIGASLKNASDDIMHNTPE